MLSSTPQGAGIHQVEEVKRLYEPEVVDECRGTVFPRYVGDTQSATTAQDLQRFKPVRVPALREEVHKEAICNR